MPTNRKGISYRLSCLFLSFSLSQDHISTESVRFLRSFRHHRHNTSNAIARKVRWPVCITTALFWFLCFDQLNSNYVAAQRFTDAFKQKWTLLANRRNRQTCFIGPFIRPHFVHLVFVFSLAFSAIYWRNAATAKSTRTSSAWRNSKRVSCGVLGYFNNAQVDGCRCLCSPVREIVGIFTNIVQMEFRSSKCRKQCAVSLAQRSSIASGDVFRKKWATFPVKPISLIFFFVALLVVAFTRAWRFTCDHFLSPDTIFNTEILVRCTVFFPVQIAQKW